MHDSVPAPGSLTEQLEYYRARAHEYDQWWLRQGRYDRGQELNGGWFADAVELNSALHAFAPAGDILELAGGTGIWSEQLLTCATTLTVVDGSPEALAINRARLNSGRAEYIEADLFEWQPQRQYDVVFFSFWLSHVPDQAFDGFWRLVRTCLAPGGRVFFIDSRKDPASTAVDHRLPARAPVAERRLNDGRTFNVYKIFYEPPALQQRLARLGWHIHVAQTNRYFIYGYGAPIAA